MNVKPIFDGLIEAARLMDARIERLEARLSYLQAEVVAAQNQIRNLQPTPTLVAEPQWEDVHIIEEDVPQPPQPPQPDVAHRQSVPGLEALEDALVRALGEK